MTNIPSYDRVTQVFHWLLAILIVFLIAYHPSTEEAHATPDALVISIHVVVGFLMLTLVPARMIWRFHFASIPPETDGGTWQSLLRQFTYIVFYVFMLLAPLTGVIIGLATDLEVGVPGLFELPQLISNESVHGIFRSAHGMSADILFYLGLLHVGAALYHQFYVKDKLLNRMVN